MKTIISDNLDIQVDTKTKRVFFPVLDSRDAELCYRHKEGENNVVEFYETYVPDELRGKGVGEELAYRAIQLAISDGQKILSTCPFVNSYLNNHPEFNAHRAK